MNRVILLPVFVIALGVFAADSETSTGNTSYCSVTVQVEYLSRSPEITRTPLASGEVASVTLRRNENPENRPHAAEPLQRTGQTDADGRVTFDNLPTGGYFIYGALGRHSGETSIYLSDFAPNAQRELWIQEGQPLIGRVLNQRGEPIAGATLTMYPELGCKHAVGFSPPACTIATTGSDGRFTFPSLWGAENWSYGVRATGYAPSYEASFRLPNKPMTISMKPGGTISGHVIEKGSGTAVANARVVLRESAPSVRGSIRSYTVTDASGAFTITDTGNGPCTVTFEHDQLVPDPMILHVGEKRGSDSSGHVLHASRGATIRGRVFDRETGAGVSGVALDIETGYAGARSVYGLTTDADGRYEATGLNTAKYQVKRGNAAAYVEDFELQEIDVEVRAGGLTEGVDFALDRGNSVAGRVRDTSGAPLAGVAVAAYGSANDRVFHKPAVYSGADGSFTLRGLATDAEVELSARIDGYVLKERPRIQIGEQSPASIDLVLSRTNSIAGVVRNTAGRPEPGLLVYARRQDAPPESHDFFRAEMNERTGGFRLENVPEGDYDLLLYPAYFRGQPTPVSTVTLEDGAHIADIQLAYQGPKTRSVHGIVVDKDGAPVQGVQLDLQELSYMGVTPTTDKSGAFTLQHVPEGEWKITASKPGQAKPLVREIEADASQVRLILWD